MPWGSLAFAVSSPSFLGAEPFGLTRRPPATLRPEGEAPSAARSGSAQRIEGRQVVATVEVVEIDQAKGRVKLNTTCTNQIGDVVVKGIATVQAPKANTEGTGSVS